MDQGANWVRPARGLDLRLQYQPAQQPHWRVNLTAEHYFGTTRAAQGQSLRHNPTAVTLGVNYTPLPLVSAGYELTLGTEKQRTHKLQLALHYHLGIPWSQQLDPRQVAAQSLSGNRLALVPRNLRMVLQQPNDEIQLELLPIAPQPVGRQVKLAIRLRSPRPLAEWTLHWRGDLLQHSPPPSINAAKDQAVVTLPRCPGTYTLQLIARNARGVVSYSNRLQIVVEALAVPAEKHHTAAVPKKPLTPVKPPKPLTIPALGRGEQPTATPDRSSTPTAKNSPTATTQPPKGEARNSERTPTRKNDQSNKKACSSTLTPPTRTPDSSTSSPGSKRSVDRNGVENGVNESAPLAKPLTVPLDNPVQGSLTPEPAMYEMPPAMPTQSVAQGEGSPSGTPADQGPEQSANIHSQFNINHPSSQIDPQNIYTKTRDPHAAKKLKIRKCKNKIILYRDLEFKRTGKVTNTLPKLIRAQSLIQRKYPTDKDVKEITSFVVECEDFLGIPKEDRYRH